LKSKEIKLTKRLNPVFGGDVAYREIYKQFFFAGRSFLTRNTTSVIGFSTQHKG